MIVLFFISIILNFGDGNSDSRVCDNDATCTHEFENEYPDSINQILKDPLAILPVNFTGYFDLSNCGSWVDSYSKDYPRLLKSGRTVTIIPHASGLADRYLF